MQTLVFVAELDNTSMIRLNRYITREPTCTCGYVNVVHLALSTQSVAVVMGALGLCDNSSWVYILELYTSTHDIVFVDTLAWCSTVQQ